MCTCTQQRMLRPCSAHDGVAKKHLRDPTGAACEACQKRMDKEENNQEKQVLSGSHQLWRHMQKFQPSQAKTRNDGPVCYHVFVWCVSACGCAGVRARGGRRACARACGCVLCVCECVCVCVVPVCLNLCVCVVNAVGTVLGVYMVIRAVAVTCRNTVACSHAWPYATEHHFSIL